MKPQKTPSRIQVKRWDTTDIAAAALNKDLNGPCHCKKQSPRGHPNPKCPKCKGTGKIKACADCGGSGWNRTTSNIVREMQREGMHNYVTQGVSLALSGMMAAWGIAVLLFHFTPHRAQSIITVLDVIAAASNVVILWLWRVRLRRFREDITETIILEIRENLENDYSAAHLEKRNPH